MEFVFIPWLFRAFPWLIIKIRIIRLTPYARQLHYLSVAYASGSLRIGIGIGIRVHSVVIPCISVANY